MDYTDIEHSGCLINLSSIKDDLICSICLDFLQSPRTLSCQHTFCTKCLEPIFKYQHIMCPQCRHDTRVSSVSKIPKNTLIEMILLTVNKSKAACPKCNQFEKLGVCDHCSCVLCNSCKQDHMQEIVKTMYKKIESYDATLKKLVQLDVSLEEAEQQSIKEIVDKMDRMKIEMLTLWQSRKLALIDEATRFYQRKLNLVKSSMDNARRIVDDVKEIDVKLNRFKENGQLMPKNNPIYQSKHIVNTLKELEEKFLSHDKAMSLNLPEFDLETSKLKLHCEKFENFNLYLDIMNKIYFHPTEADNQLLKDVKITAETLGTKTQLELKPLFGKPVTLEFNSNSEIRPDVIRKKLVEQTSLVVSSQTGESMASSVVETPPTENDFKIIFYNCNFVELKEDQLADICKRIAKTKISPRFDLKFPASNLGTQINETASREDTLLFSMSTVGLPSKFARVKDTMRTNTQRKKKFIAILN